MALGIPLGKYGPRVPFTFICKCKETESRWIGTEKKAEHRSITVESYCKECWSIVTGFRTTGYAGMTRSFTALKCHVVFPQFFTGKIGVSHGLVTGTIVIYSNKDWMTGAIPASGRNGYCC